MNFIPKIEYIELGTGLTKTVQFDSPPEGDPFNEELIPSVTVTQSNNGTKQTQFNYLKEKFSLEFIFQSEAVKTAMQDFYENHAIRGGSFDYYPSSDETEFKTYTFSRSSLGLARPIPTETLGQFEYDFSFAIERVKSVI